MGDQKKAADKLYGIRRTILVVDDEEVNRELLKKYLRDDYELLFACNGLEALKICHENAGRIALIMLDLVMPVMDGYEFMEVAGKEPDISPIPIIVTTVKDMEEDEIHALRLGASDFVTKPYSPEIMKLRVSRTISQVDSESIISRLERDTVTGLYSENFFFSYADRLKMEYPDVSWDVLCVDIENYHLVIDMYGKEEAENILRAIAEILRDDMWNSGAGIACRSDSDLFFMILPHRNDYKTFLRKVFSSFESRPDIHHVILHFGIYQNIDREEHIEKTCDKVISTVYKTRGVSSFCVTYYDKKMRDELMERQILIEELPDALRDKQFEVYYQPKCSLPDGKLVGAEALVRWNNPERGFMPPDSFIPLFEKNGQIYQVDKFVWEETCRQIREWIDRFGSCVPISVNISRTDVYDPKMPDVISEFVKKYDLDIKQLHLEITESAYMRDPSQLVKIVENLRNRGFVVEMDDFGSGYSSLNMIAGLPIDILKLDMRFLRDDKDGGKSKDTVNSEKSVLLRSIMDIADWKKVPAIAEGVETKDQVGMLTDLKCGYGQGYFFSRPVPAREFEKFLEDPERSLIPETENCRKN